MTRKKAKPKTGLIWLSGIAVALAVHAAGLYLFQVDEQEQAVAAPDQSFVTVPPAEAHDGRLLREWAYLFDSSPLFFPTRWNASSAPAVTLREQRPEPLFLPFPARLSYGERDFGLGAIVTARTETPLESLEAFEDPIHATFGTAEVGVPEFADRFALVEVLAPEGEGAVFEVAIPAEGAPGNGNQLWSPAEFLVQIVPTGRVGAPTLLRGTGSEAIDQFLGAALGRLLREKMLPPGYYRVRAGP